jgi:PIN domain nuclease of toxin-antitoxin system
MVVRSFQRVINYILIPMNRKVSQSVLCLAGKWLQLVEKNRLRLEYPVLEWINLALNYPGLNLLNLTPAIVVDAHKLPGAFHKDPVDRLLVATARFAKLSLMSIDTKILEYPHVAVWKRDE